jgi:1-acyl-sn-glycerol-3-phosphate acyltransferase
MRVVIAVLRPFVWLLCRLWFKIDFRGVENVPSNGACLITPNHVTYADPIWITIPIRRRIYYMAWDKPFEIPVLGLLMRVFGAFPVRLESADTSAHRSAIAALHRGSALVIFPEAGRSKTGQLMPFKPGAFRLALAYGVPIVPVSIKGAYQIWPVGKILPRPGRLIITYHPPLVVERLAKDTTRVDLKAQASLLAQRTQQIVASALGATTMAAGKDDGVIPSETHA